MNIKKVIGIIADGSFGLTMLGLGAAEICIGIKIIKWITKESDVLSFILDI